MKKTYVLALVIFVLSSIMPIKAGEYLDNWETKGNLSLVEIPRGNAIVDSTTVTPSVASGCPSSKACYKGIELQWPHPNEASSSNAWKITSLDYYTEGDKHSNLNAIDIACGSASSTRGVYPVA